ncbi:MAG: C10 family peptidase [Bacteroidaceae bacterium]|nr:C10 family peptidase [Bacteroidaceae bacterium]
MKNILYIATVVMLFAACNNEVMEFNQQEITQQKQLSKNRTVSEAIDIANNAVGQFFEVTRAGGKVVDIDNIEVVTSSATRSGGEGGDTLLYVVNYADNNGFAVVSASRNTEGLLAVTEQGNYDPIVESKNGGFEMFMDMAEEYVSNAIIEIPEPELQDPIIYPRKEIREEVDTTIHIDIAPKLEVQWGQYGIEGQFAPNGLAGCANTAAAQIMSYFCYPTQINLSYLGDNARNLYLDWDAMKYHKGSHKHGCVATLEAHNAISYLHRELGKRNNSYYNNFLNETTTEITNVISTFRSLGYTATGLINYYNIDFASFLNYNDFIYMTGSTHSQGSGHAWVIDGGKKSIITIRYWTRTQGSLIWELHSEFTSETEYYHHNWGYDGDYNGYFNANVFDMSNARSYDNDTLNNEEADPQNFRYNLKFFIVRR